MKKKFVIYENLGGKTVEHTVLAADKVEALQVFASMCKIFVFDVAEISHKNEVLNGEDINQ